MNDISVLEDSPAVLAPSELQLAVNTEAEKREILRKYVKDQLVDGQDYGTIPLGSGKASKPTLFKQGMEKILSLMKVTSEVCFDKELSEFLSGPTSKIVAYHCSLSQSGNKIADGDGSCSVQEKRGDANTAIKIAQKRARMDACLSLGFSEYFTQDLEDTSTHDVSKVEHTSPVQSAAKNVFSNDLMKSWKDKEIRTLVVVVLSKEIVTSKSGVQYAALQTDLGPMKAWKETFSLLEENGVYDVDVTGSIWNGSLSLVITRVSDPLTEEQPF